MNFRKVSALAGVAVLAFAACSSPGAATNPPASAGGGTSQPPAASGGTAPSAPASVDTSKGKVKVAVGLPYQGSEKAASEPIFNGVKLAFKEAGGGAGGYAIEVPDVFDDAVNGAHDPQTGARNMTTVATDPEFVAFIGPLNSSVGAAEIPISNEAGLLQCSPANTAEGLTKPEFGALDVRKANPDTINYVRVVTTDDNQGPAAARYILENLGKKNVFIIDDTETFGDGIADNFEKYFEENGGTVVDRQGVPKTTTDYAPIMTAAKAKNPEAIYFGGVTATGGARILNAAIQAGLDVPYVGPDGIYDGSAATKDSFLNLAGANAKNSYATAAAVGDFPGREEFAARYKAEYGSDPTGYSATGYACAQVVIDALNRANPSGDMAAVREAVRAAAVDPSVTYTTVIGEFKFDENGDTSQKIISFYAYDATGADGKGDWKFKEQIDFAK
ncbi:MAG TPA: branched-chain amino acid ABC transporter substrate-binding protein [Candidatus Limnocylindrales bacterium]|nr:branched-chain amino acid ABC transporter substrate-binding protein [Candidatus Limnocylindrales bacterium]